MPCVNSMVKALSPGSLSRAFLDMCLAGNKMPWERQCFSIELEDPSICLMQPGKSWPGFSTPTKLSGKASPFQQCLQKR